MVCSFFAWKQPQEERMRGLRRSFLRHYALKNNNNHPSPTLLPSSWLKRLKGAERPCLWEPHDDTLRWPTPVWAQADGWLMSLREGTLQTASWITHRLPLTCASMQSEPAASRAPERLCKLRDSRPTQRMQSEPTSSSRELQNRDWWCLLTRGLCCSVNIFVALELSDTLKLLRFLCLSPNEDLCILWAIKPLPRLEISDPAITML